MESKSVFLSAARTATPTAAVMVNDIGTRAVIIIKATAVTATPALTVSVYGYDPITTHEWLILASTAIATAVTTVLKIGPGLTAAANLVANDQMPPNFIIRPVHGDADPITYQISVQLMP